MKLDYKELDNGIRQITLSGALDLNGTYSIEVEFVRLCEGETVRMLVDLSQVSYISSIGIQLLINSANSVVSRGGKLVFLNPQENILKVMDLVGVPSMTPIHTSVDSALADLTA